MSWEFLFGPLQYVHVPAQLMTCTTMQTLGAVAGLTHDQPAPEWVEWALEVTVVMYLVRGELRLPGS